MSVSGSRSETFARYEGSSCLSPFRTVCESKNGNALTEFKASASSWMSFIRCGEISGSFKCQKCIFQIGIKYSAKIVQSRLYTCCCIVNDILL